MFLSNHDRVDLIDVRHELHRQPEIFGEERKTAGVFMRVVRNILGWPLTADN